MNTQQSSTLRMYLNDMLAVEKDLSNATQGQATDENVGKLSEVSLLIQEIARTSEARVKTLESLSEQHDGKWGAVVKEAVASAAGVLAGIYGKVRTHPVSRMLRDDHVALNVASIAYGMLYTTAVAFDDDKVAEASLEALNETASQVIRLATLIPGVVVGELATESPVHSGAAGLGVEAILAAWDEAAQNLPQAAGAK